MTYEDACKLEAESPAFKRGINAHQLAQHTRLHRVDDSTFVVRYHSTEVVTIHSDGSYTLDSGGRMSPTVRRRIEQFSPFFITTDGNYVFNKGSVFLDFQDGMRLTPNTHKETHA